MQKRLQIRNVKRPQYRRYRRRWNGEREFWGKWLERNALAIGDVVEVTNYAGKSYTGRLERLHYPLCVMRVANGVKFFFSPLDCDVQFGTLEKKKADAELSLFVMPRKAANVLSVFF